MDSVNQDYAINSNEANNCTVYGNIAYDVAFGFQGTENAFSAVVYNNTFVARNRAINQSGGTATTHYFKNNILDGGDYDMKIGSVSTVEGGYNIFKNDAAVDSGGSTYNGSANDFYTTDPQYTNAGGNDYTIIPGGFACVGALPITGYNTRLDPTSSWPDDVRTIGSTEEFGAYGCYKGARLQ